jgi:Xaa-Pro dipeptidase
MRCCAISNAALRRGARSADASGHNTDHATKHRKAAGDTMNDRHAGQSDLVPPVFLSLSERDRRHRLIREKMAADGLDVLVLPASHARWEQCMADSRYATGIGGFGTETLTVFVRDHAPTVFVFNRAGWWRSVQEWIADVRDGRNEWGSNVVERLGEIGFRRGRIGLSGLDGQTRTPDGVVPHRMMQRLASAFPEAELIDATGLIQELRSVKSAEEIAVLERAALITDKMVATMIDLARPGMTERQVYAGMLQTMLVEGGDLPVLMIFAAGPAVNHGQFVPTQRALRAGDRIANEIEARIAGYGAQAVAPLVLGRADDHYKEAVAISRAAFDAVSAALRPGATLPALLQLYRDTVRREGKGRFSANFPLMHARGLGDEVPVVLGEADVVRQAEVPLRENMCFVLKPRIVGDDGRVQAQIGDTVQVTPTGGRRLAQRPLALIETG